jgi:hypothetical protein
MPTRQARRIRIQLGSLVGWLVGWCSRYTVASQVLGGGLHKGFKHTPSAQLTAQAVGIKQINPAVRGKPPGQEGADPIIAYAEGPTQSVCLGCDCLTAHGQENPGTAPPSPWRAGRAARTGTYRQDGVWTGVEKGTYCSSPALPPHF